MNIEEELTLVPIDPRTSHGNAFLQKTNHVLSKDDIPKCYSTVVIPVKTGIHKNGNPGFPLSRE